MTQIENGKPAIPEEAVLYLDRETSSHKRQDVLDKIFTDERREAILQTASRDRLGRPVRYFRYMSNNMLFRLLREGEQTPLSYHTSPDGLVDPNRIKQFVSSYIDFRQFTTKECSPLGARLLRWLPTSFAFAKLFENAPQKELRGLLNDFTYRKALPFFDNYADGKFNRRMYTAASYLGLSPYLAVSVGGILLIPEKDRSHIELSIPDEDIIPHHGQPGPEKEAFTRKINTSHILRVYINADKLLANEVFNPYTPIGQHYRRIKTSFYNRTQDAIDRWRCDEDINDYLPVALAAPH